MTLIAMMKMMNLNPTSVWSPSMLWLPEMNRGAEVFAAEVVLHGPREAVLEFEDLPYRVAIQNSLQAAPDSV